MAPGWVFATSARAAAAEARLDSTDKHPVTPGSILPAREQLGDLLAELGRPAGALAEYESSLRSAPARLNSCYGAARSAEVAGQVEKARRFADQLVTLCAGAVPARAELPEGRAKAEK